MAKTSTIETPDELKNLQQKAHEQRDRFFLGVVQGHKSEPSKIRKQQIRELSLFGYLAQFWRELTTEEKDVWKSAAAYSSLTNWQLYISDNAARIRNGLSLDVPPSDLWQVRAGRILIESPASEIILKQEHPQKYFIAQKISGTPWKKEIVPITENFGLPLDLSIRYKSTLSVADGYLVPASSGTISGQVTLSSNPVDGATVRCIRQSDNTAIAEQTTDSSGLYTFSGLDSDDVYHLAVEYEADSVKYNAKSIYGVVDVEIDFELSSFSVPDSDAVNFELSSFTTLTPRARYYATVWTSYQGVNVYTDFAVNFDAVSDWQLDSIEADNLRGIIVGYTLFLEIIGYTGELLFDNIRATHGGTNWARDPRCDEVDHTFQKAFAVIPPFWIPVSLPSGVQFYSAYPPSLS